LTTREVGPYRLEQVLGRGGMGTVWQAWDDRLKRPVAIKQILPEALGSPGARQRFRREAEAGARLNHPSIVHIYDVVDTTDGEWIVMELVEGESLRHRLEAGPLTPLQAMRLGIDVADGLAEAHGRGIIHRDLKASNVMLTPAGRAKILDFGIAKIWTTGEEGTLSAPGQVLGTCHAMSPEQAMGMPLDARSDLFSLGSLLYEALSGAAAFLGPTPAATLTQVCHVRPAPLVEVRPEAPQDLSELIEALLEKDPAHRPQTAREVATRLGLMATRPGTAGAIGESLPHAEETTSPSTLVFPLRNRPPIPSGSPSSHTGTTFRGRKGFLALGAAAVLAAGLATAPFLINRPPLASLGSYGQYRQAQELLERYDRPGQVDQAIEMLQILLAKDNDSAPVLSSLSRAYWRKYLGSSKDPMWLDRAEPLARRAVEIEPYLASARLSLGLVHAAGGRPEEALQELRKALDLDPLDADAQGGLGRVFASQGKLAEAEKAYRRAFELRHDREFSDDLGVLLLRMGRIDEAVAAFQRSVALAPDSVISHRNLGGAFYLQGKLAEAAAEFQAALEISPHASIYSNLGTIYFAQGFYPKAVDAFERALRMPGAANDYLVWANLADAHRWLPGHRAEARETYLRAIQLVRERLRGAPADPVLRSRLAVYLAKRGDREQALTEIARAEKVSSEDASSWYRLAVASEVCGERERALAALARALQKGYSIEEAGRDPEMLALREDLRYHRLMTAAPGYR
jgi:eukaryotic-like serine/threonine-protein kinase